MRAIDLFCGCGGLSAGLRDAGYEIMAGIDIEPHYIQTFSENFPESESICEDVAETSPRSLLNRFDLRVGELDLLAGGPPCQGFSKNVPRSQRQIDSKHNKLVGSFLSHCETLLPRCVLIENVAEMKNGFGEYYTDEIVRRLTNSGYKVIYGIHNVADYGIPQKRRRVFFMARRDGITPRSIQATHAISGKSDSVIVVNPHVTVWQAISDLRSLKHGEIGSPNAYYTEPQNEYQKYARNGCKFTYNHVAKKLKSIQYERISSLLPGQGIKDLPIHLRPKGGYSGAYGRLTRDMVMPTITRWVFHPGSGRWGHPEDLRLITIREAARLHGYKDCFKFLGSYNQQSGQLGNSVPPLMAKFMGESFLSTH